MTRFLILMVLILSAGAICAQDPSGISQGEFRRWTSEKNVRRIAAAYHAADKLQATKLSKEELNELFEGCRSMVMFQVFITQALSRSTARDLTKQKLADLYIAWYLHREYIIADDPVR